MTISGDSGYVPSIDPKISMIEIGYKLNNTTVSVSSNIMVTHNNKIEYSWDIGPRSIGDDFNLIVTLKNYVFRKTPFLNNIS